MNSLIKEDMSLEEAILVGTEGCTGSHAISRTGLIKHYVAQGLKPREALLKLLETVIKIHEDSLTEEESELVEETLLDRTKPSVYALNKWFAEALRVRKDSKELQGTKLLLFGIKETMDNYLTNLIWTAVVVCELELVAKFAEGGERVLNKDNYWLVIANFGLTDSIVVKE